MITGHSICFPLVQIDLLFFAILYLSSYVVICHYKRQADKEDYFSGEVKGHFPIDITSGMISPLHSL